ncbi:MAG: AAA family ATPase [Paludibacteraceae bacterium]|nr:AAA family ATPase [Paludibacteraceae bacterium]
METLIDKYTRIIKATSMDFERHCMSSGKKEINWDTPLMALRGQKGVGKSTLMLQYIKRNYSLGDRSVLYCSCDWSYFATHTILELVDVFWKNGGKHIFLDEIHKYENWSSEIKEIYDTYPELKIVISGSSLLKLMEGESDLSRRCINHEIQGLSFREFLHFYKNIELPVSSLDDILKNSWEICEMVNDKCKPLPMFKEYLRYGYYPYYKKLKNPIDYQSAIEQVMNYVIDDELPRICGVDFSNTRKIKALMNILASTEPFEVDISRFSVQSGLQRNTIIGYLSHLDNANMINLLYSDYNNIKKMQKPDKIYLENSNIHYALAPTKDVHIGTIRETFAVNQLSYQHKVEYSKSRADFSIDDKYTFEIGGKDKGFEQIAGIPDSYVFADDIEYPSGEKLPLYLLGLMY